jgi:succinate dehydrogenase / fumarate reductase membrane anchor subunit
LVTLMLDGLRPGLRTWVLQRATAVIMFTYMLVMFTLLLLQQPSHYEAWRSLMAPLWIRILTLLFLLSLYVHAWLGVKNVLGDYVKPKWLQFTLKLATLLSLLFYTLWSVQILWSM